MTNKILSPLLIVLVIVLAAASISAAAPADIEKGIKPGINLSSFSSKVLGFDWKISVGFTAGFSLSIPLTSFFAIQPELFYSQKATVHKDAVEGGTLRSTMKLSYLDLPVLARISIPIGSEAQVRPYFLGGASFSLKVGAKLLIDYVNSYGYATPIEEDTVEGLKSTNFNFVLGAGIDFAVQGGRILIEGRYSRPFSTLSTEGLNIRLSVISILVGYLF